MPMKEQDITYDRRKRIQRLKKIIIGTILSAILIPIIICVILLVRTNSLTHQLQAMSDQMDALLQTIEGQQQELERLKDEAHTGLGSVSPGETERVVESNRIVAEEEQPEEVVAEDPYEGKIKVYLTFDDGPSGHTEKILDILDTYGVKATFFVVGKEDEEDIQRLQDIVARGHAVGMHSYSHVYSQIYASVDAFREDYNRIHELIEQVTGIDCKLYRFPGGSSNTVSSISMEEFAEFLDTEGVRFFDWNVSSGDATKESLSRTQLIRNVLSGIGEHDTEVILFHDATDKKTTLDALPEIIENILAREDTVLLPITEDTEPVQHIR